MTMFKMFKVPPHRMRERASKRLSALDKGMVLDWTDVCLAGVWKALEDYRKAPDEALLLEAESGLQQVLGAVDALRIRS